MGGSSWPRRARPSSTYGRPLGIDKTLSALYDGWRQLSEASRLWLAPPRCPCHFYGAIPASTGAVEPSGSVDLTGSR